MAGGELEDEEASVGINCQIGFDVRYNVGCKDLWGGYGIECALDARWEVGVHLHDV